MLSDRQKLILQIIIDDYVRSAEPVGSRTISKRGDVTFSPATIRNEMSDLEDMGYLSQPHTSAGRIPSNKGYRFYVDHLIRPEKISSEDIHHAKMIFARKFVEFEQLIQQTASVLSDLTSYTVIALGPDVFNTSLRHIQLVPLSNQSAVAIVVTNTGHVENKKISIPEGISLAEMERLVHLLNAKLGGVPVYQLRGRMYSEIALELKKHFDNYKEAIHIMEQALSSDKEEKIFLGGTTKIFAQPEFRDVERVRGLFEWLEQHDRIHGMISSVNPQDGIHIRIGQENIDEAVSHCSIITASYLIGGKPLGKLSILGPTRMEYRKVIGLLGFVSENLSHLLNDWYEKGS